MTKTGDGWMDGILYRGYEYVPEVRRECRYRNWNTTSKTGLYIKSINLGKGLYWFQSGVFLTKFGHILLLFLSAQPDNV